MIYPDIGLDRDEAARRIAAATKLSREYVYRRIGQGVPMRGVQNGYYYNYWVWCPESDVAWWTEALRGESDSLL